MSARDLFAGMDHMKTGMAVYDKDLNLIFANKTIRSYLPNLYASLDSGLSMMESIIAQAKVTLPKTNSDSLERRAAYIYETIKNSGTLEVTTPTGRKLNSSYDQTSQGHYIVTTTDVTARVKNEEALSRAKYQADAANIAKTEYLANMSHELRTPLSGISMSAQLLQRQLQAINKPELNVLAGILVESTGHLTEIINDVLDLSKIEAGQIDIILSENSLVEMLTTLQRSQASVATDRGIELKLVINPNLPARLLYDPCRVRQCVTNLVSNALKFTTSGGVTIEAQLDPENDSVTIHVTDTGIGIAPDNLDQVFDHFEQVKNDASKTAGTGLGLAISRKLARLMGGDIILASKLGTGSTFTLTFPWNAAAHEAQPLSKSLAATG